MSLATRIADLALRVATEVKAVRTLINGNAIDLTGLNTTTKANLVAAINEVVAAAAAAQTTATGKPSIDDGAASSSSTYSSNKIASLVSTAVSQVVDSSPAALDTLKELAIALGNDANFATTVSTALGNRLRVDAEQALTAGQRTQGRSNLEVYSTTQVGNPETNFVTVFVDGLA